jgi:hypothetical protein
VEPIEAIVYFVRSKAKNLETGEISVTSFGPFVLEEDAKLAEQLDEKSGQKPGYEYEYSIEAVPTKFPLPPK